MVRVFVLGLLALGALVLVVRGLPSPAAAPRLFGGEDAITDNVEGLARWDGVWEGTLRRYEPDGSLESATRERREHTTLSQSEQTLRVQDEAEGAAPQQRRGRITWQGGRLGCQIWNPDGSVMIADGRMAGRVIFWHRRDERTGLEESVREEILRLPDGDLYTLDGWGIYPRSGGGQARLTLEGRYRRSARDAE